MSSKEGSNFSPCAVPAWFPPVSPDPILGNTPTQCSVTEQPFESSFQGFCDNVPRVLYESFIQPFPAATISLENGGQGCAVTFTIETVGGTIIKMVESQQKISLTVNQLKRILGQPGLNSSQETEFSASGTLSYCLNQTM